MMPQRQGLNSILLQKAAVFDISWGCQTRRKMQKKISNSDAHISNQLNMASFAKSDLAFRWNLCLCRAAKDANYNSFQCRD